MKNFNIDILPTSEKEQQPEENSSESVASISDQVIASVGGGGGGEPPPPIDYSIVPDGVAAVPIVLTLAVLIFALKSLFSKKFKEMNTLDDSKFKEINTLDNEHPEVIELVKKIYQQYPRACRNCYATATEPEYSIEGTGEEECRNCYAKGLDPYDTTKKMKMEGDYKISPTFGVDPLYRGYGLPGADVLALREMIEESK